jgi:CO dehydrogenase/acetyl-CoA synthase beta subunit
MLYSEDKRSWPEIKRDLQEFHWDTTNDDGQRNLARSMVIEVEHSARELEQTLRSWAKSLDHNATEVERYILATGHYPRSHDINGLGILQSAASRIEVQAARFAHSVDFARELAVALCPTDEQRATQRFEAAREAVKNPYSRSKEQSEWYDGFKACAMGQPFSEQKPKPWRNGWASFNSYAG